METGTENRNNTEFFAGNFFYRGGYKRRLNNLVCKGKIAACFIINQAGNFGYQITEFLCGSGFLSHDTNFMLDQGMIHNKYIRHNSVLPFI